MMRTDLETRFAYHPAADDQTRAAHQRVREVCLSAAVIVVARTPPSREQSLAITHLEQAMFWANAAIARNPVNQEDHTA